MSYRLIAVAAVATLSLQACAPKPQTAAVEIDPFSEGIAKTCEYSPVQLKSGTTMQATITMTNDGWCAFRASEKQGTAYLLGLVKDRPDHGEVQVRKWNGESRLEYNPNPGFVGADKFTVALRPQEGGADALVQVTATVSKGAGVAVAPPPAETKPTPATTRRAPARRGSARR